MILVMNLIGCWSCDLTKEGFDSSYVCTDYIAISHVLIVNS